MSEAFRDISPEAPELQPIISGLFAEYAARYGDYFSRDAEVELSEWYLPPQGLFIVLEREGEIIATGAYKPKDRHTAEIKSQRARGSVDPRLAHTVHGRHRALQRMWVGRRPRAAGVAPAHATTRRMNRLQRGHPAAAHHASPCCSASTSARMSAICSFISSKPPATPA